MTDSEPARSERLSEGAPASAAEPVSRTAAPDGPAGASPSGSAPDGGDLTSGPTASGAARRR
ncbi:MAG: hypothetical protein JWN46_3012, partial [Acidimicrobiales bacterium]|nr:hypothetical protein [Acidimicrobiales bacterium]